MAAATLLPPFYLGYIQLGKLLYCRSVRPLPLPMAWNLLHDQLFVPRLSFHTEEEIMEWASRYGLDVIDKGRELLGQTLCVLMVKK